MATDPTFFLSEKLLSNLARIHFLVDQLNKAKLPRSISIKLEHNARFLSVQSTASLAGLKVSQTVLESLVSPLFEAKTEAERLVLNYDRSRLKLLKELVGTKTIGRITPKQILRLHNDVTKNLPSHSLSGAYRVDSFPAIDRTPSAPYYPPRHTEIPQLIEMFCSYMERQQNVIDPIILAGIFHKQFLLFRPFTGGNHRIARLYTMLILAGIGVQNLNLFSFENFYRKRSRKYRLLTSEAGTYATAASADFTPWLEFFTDGIIDELIRVEKSLPESLKTEVVGQFGELVKAITNLNRPLGRPLVIGISGYCGSGKSTLAENLRHHLQASVISIDHFAMGSLTNRDDEWSCYDRQRCKEQVLIPATQGEQVAYEVYDWLEEKLGSRTEVSSTSEDIIILEGVGVFHPDLRPYFDYAIWIDCPLDVAIQRGIKRSQAWGYDHDQKWVEIWMPNERDFYAKYHPDQFVDFTFVTHDTVPNQNLASEFPKSATSMSFSF